MRLDDLSDEEHMQHIGARASLARPHPNGAIGIYSVCVTTPDFDGTIAAFQANGLSLRRVRRADDPASALSRGLSMAFFKFGAPPGRDVILELVAPPPAPASSSAGDAAVSPAVAIERAGFPVGPQATIAGLVVEVPSIAPLVSLLGPELLGAERDAAQGHGRRIAPLKHKAAGLPLPLAFITPSTGAP